MPKPSNARELAFAVLTDFEQTGGFAATSFENRLAELPSDFPDNERRLAAEIIYGIVRRYRTLDAIIEPCVSRPRERIETGLWTLLNIGTYQLVFLNSVPPHAAVHETVNVCRWTGQPRWAGFLNGVLRSVQRSLTAEIIEHPAADAVPLSAGNYRKCNRVLFPDPQADPAGFFAAAFSFPDWLAQRWAKRFDFDELVRLGFWFNKPADIRLRVNLLKTTREEMLQALKHAGVDTEAYDLPEAIRLSGTARIRQLPGFAEGWFTVQDESAMQAARLLNPQPGQTVLDLCAAPGTKTTHLAELMQNRGTIIATDVDPERLQLITDNARRLGLSIIRTQQISRDGTDIPPGLFDAVLLDVPCSNTGVLGKRPEARRRLQPEDLKELPALQKRLLEDACGRLKPEGRLVYSTCSMEPEENGEVVNAILESRPEMQLVKEQEHVPGKPADGGYAALLTFRG